MSENNKKTLGDLYAEKYGKESGQPQTGDAIPVDTTKKDKAVKNLTEAVKTIDKIASKGIIHKNKAANKKSSLYKHTNNLK